MSNWQLKSDYSFDAANKLINVGLFNTSIHSSYYACVQYVYHIMCSFWGEEIDRIEKGSNAFAANMGTHQWLRTEVYNSMKLRDKPAAVKFRDAMGDLCSFRVKADYLYKIIEEQDAVKCNNKAVDLVSLLIQHYDA